MLTVLALWSSAAQATVDPECAGLSKPANYDEQVQQDFLSNYVVLATTLSPIHGPIPHAPGRGAAGVDLAIIPPLGCGQRMVLEWTKTEDTNKSPVVPRPRVSFAFKPIADVVHPYAGVAFVPEVEIAGTRNFLLSGEAGVGFHVGHHLQLALRGHGTMQRTLGDIATAFEEDEPAYADLYVASSVGGDLHLGWEVVAAGHSITPYLAVGLTDVQTFFWIGDDSVVTNNFHPYFGPAASLGVDTLLFDHVRLAAELYAAPGGHSLPDPDAPTVEDDPFTRYGNLYTGRLRLAWEL